VPFPQQISNKYLTDPQMSNLKQLMRLFRMALFGFMLAVCIVMGVAPVIPKRKEEFTVEIKMEETEKKEAPTATITVVGKH
jgi:type IV secretory pathway component VirB8